MSEKRRPELVFRAEIRGINGSTRKRLATIELFPASQWEGSTVAPMFGKGKQTGMSFHETRGDVYRIRVDGKWWKDLKRRQTYTLSEFFAIYRNAVVQSRKKFRRSLRGKKSNGS